MALLLLTVLGLSLGWFASIIARTETPGSILSQMALAFVASLGVGIFMNSGTILGSLSWLAFGAAAAAIVVVLVAFHALFTWRAF